MNDLKLKTAQVDVRAILESHSVFLSTPTIDSIVAAALAQGAEPVEVKCPHCEDTFMTSYPEVASETAAGAVSEAVRTALKKLYLAGWNDAMDNTNDVHAQAKAVHDTILALATPPAATQVPSDGRDDAEGMYAVTAHDYAKAPIGSRDWTLFWSGWQKGRAALARTQSAPPAAQQIGGVEGTRERMAFYEAQMKNPATHAALAMEMAYLRKQDDERKASGGAA